MFLIVGLGNPGKQYNNNRHNIGFKVVDAIKDIYNFPKFIKRFDSEFSKSEIDGNIIFLIKPTTFMNNSGMAVKEFKNFYNFDINKIYVIHDEIDLDQGRIKTKIGGGHNGHNGLKSIDQLVGKDYNRIRVGISRPSKKIWQRINEVGPQGQERLKPIKISRKHAKIRKFRNASKSIRTHPNASDCI